jgi:hypothetical protein
MCGQFHTQTVLHFLYVNNYKHDDKVELGSYMANLTNYSKPVLIKITYKNNLSSPHAQTSSGAHAASYPMGTRGSFPGGKVVGA